MAIVTASCALRCEGSKAPTESDVDQMYAALAAYAVRKGYGGMVGERQYWDGIFRLWSDDTVWTFTIFRDYNVP